MTRERLQEELARLVGREDLLCGRAQGASYSYDASIFRGELPLLVVLPESTQETAAVMQVCHREGIPVVGRGSGTNISGGTILRQPGVLIHFSKMDRILCIDLESERAVVQPGVINGDLKAALAPHGYTYAPDPSSQSISTIGGNAAENAGGPHCLKYGITTNHVLGMVVVLTDGTVVEAGGWAPDGPGCDLTALFVGSEGTLGLTTELTLRIVRLPEAVETLLAVFDRVDDAAEAVCSIIAEGIVPTTLEMMDGRMIRLLEARYRFGYPTDAEGVLLIEVDGLREGLREMGERIESICRRHRVRSVERARSDAERDRLWQARRAAFATVVRVKPRCYTVDGVVPRTQIPRVLRDIYRICDRYGLPVCNVLHAGDGNVHPLISFGADPGEEERVIRAGREIMEACVAAEGSITGEHGVGIEKQAEMSLLFSPDELEAMSWPKKALDPRDLANPGKLLPLPTGGV